MPEWDSPEEFARDERAFIMLLHAMLGVYIWEFLVSFNFDLDFILRRKKFRWPMIFYFANRYLLLGALIGVIVLLNIRVKVNCRAFYTFNQLAGTASIGLASINLGIRTIAVYSYSPYIIALFAFLILGQWSITVFQAAVLNAEWIPQVKSCVIANADDLALRAMFLYAMTFDLIVLLLNTCKLMQNRWGTSTDFMGATTKMIFKDGLIYFFIAFFVNLVAATFTFMRPNAVMGVIFNVPAIVISTMAACRMVRRLSNFVNDDPTAISTISHSIRFRTMESSTQVELETFRIQSDIERGGKAQADESH